MRMCCLFSDIKEQSYSYVPDIEFRCYMDVSIDRNLWLFPPSSFMFSTDKQMPLKTARAAATKVKKVVEKKEGNSGDLVPTPPSPLAPETITSDFVAGRLFHQ